MAQFVLKIAKLSHIIGAGGSEDLRSPSSIMAPESIKCFSLAHDWSKRVMRPKTKTGEYPSDIPKFAKLRLLRKIFEG